MTIGYERKAREPGGVEAGRADYYIDRVVGTFEVRKAISCYGADWIGEDGCIGCNERFKIPWCWCGTTTPWIEVLGYHFLDEAGIIVEFVSHLCVCVFAS